MTYEEIKEEYDLESIRVSDLLNSQMSKLDFSEYMSLVESESERMEQLSREMRLLQKPIFSEIPDYGDLMKMSDFISCCESGGFIDYDGFGNYSRGGRMSDIKIYPSDITNEKFRNDFDYVVWFNR